jgi:type III restriction enzyme
VPARANQRHAAAEIVDCFLRGLGTSAETVLSGYLDRAAAGLVQLVTEEQRKVATRPSYGEVVELTTFDKVRSGKLATTKDRYGDFKGKKGIGFEGYRKSLYAQDWFDSSTERDVANILEDAPQIVLWVRLQIGDLPILWNEAREYNPDFIAVDGDDVHWIVEVKMDKEMTSSEVQGKRNAARRWANYVSGDEKVGAVWRYLLISESDVSTARGSWVALNGLGGYDVAG